MDVMRIFIDGTTLCDETGNVGAGIEQYSWCITEHLLRVGSEHEFFILIPDAMSSTRENQLKKIGSHVHTLRSRLPTFPFVSRHIFFPLRAKCIRPDIFFSPFGQLPFFWKGKSVITIHDVSIFEHPEWFPESDHTNWSVRWIVPRSIERAAHIIAVSEWTKQRLAKRFPETDKKTVVIPEGVLPPEGLLSATTPSSRFPFDREYIFFIGTIEPRKNLVHALKAFDRFLQAHPEWLSQVRFILAGKKGWKTDEIDALANDINDRWHAKEPHGVIQFLGPVTEEEKWTLIDRASCLVFVSHEEGFGLPVLEAMSVGTPVIASTAAALKEVGGEAILTVEPTDVEALSFAIAQCLLVPDVTKEMRVLGYHRARQFTWELAAEKTLEVLIASFGDR